MIVSENVHDLFECGAQTLVCPVNTVGVMGNGLAHYFKVVSPEFFQKYRSMCTMKKFKITSLWLYPHEDVQFLAFPTKQHWSQPSKAEWIETNLKKFVETYKAKGITSLAIPHVGCGKGGLSYEHTVRPLLFKYLDPLDIPVHICIRLF